MIKSRKLHAVTTRPLCIFLVVHRVQKIAKVKCSRVKSLLTVRVRQVTPHMVATKQYPGNRIIMNKIVSFCFYWRRNKHLVKINLLCCTGLWQYWLVSRASDAQSCPNRVVLMFLFCIKNIPSYFWHWSCHDICFPLTLILVRPAWQSFQLSEV